MSARPIIPGLSPEVMLGGLSAQQTAMLQEAVAYASRAHRNQLRKDGRTPYASHVIRVAFTTLCVFGCSDFVVIMSAILHDTIEDTTTDYEDIDERFGPEIARVVSALTKNMALPEHDRERDYDARLALGPWQARLVKLADVFDNLCDMESMPQHQRARKLADALARCHRALSLTQSDAHRPEFARAHEALRSLVAAQPPQI
jgi:(p)ppGpp synthase/HD superfamily hydrolase